MSTNEIVLKGKVEIVLLENFLIRHKNKGHTVTVGPFDLESSINSLFISWDGIPPTDLQSLTLPKFLMLSDWNKLSSFKTTVFLTGIQNGINPPAATMKIEVSDNNRTYRQIVHEISTNSLPGDSGTWKTSPTINDIQGFFNFGVSQVASLTHSSGFGTPDASDVNYKIVIDIIAILSCTGTNLDTESCSFYCSESKNIEKCKIPYLNYCTPNVIHDSQNCRNYLVDYIKTNGPIKQLDDTLIDYCTSKYEGFGDLFNDPTKATQERLLDIDLCGCHMGTSEGEFYTNFAKEVLGDYDIPPGIFPQIDLCFVPQCISSNYPANPIKPGGCQIPNCLNIIVFDNDGTFDNSNVTINQESSGCNNVKNKNQPSPPSPEPTDNTLFWIILAIIVLIIALIIYSLI